MVLVAMRQHDGLDLVTVLEEIRDVRNDEVDAEHVLLREHQPRIDEQDLVLVTHDRHVLSDFAKAAERDDL